MPMNIKNFQQIIQEQIISIYNINSQIEYLFDNFFWSAQFKNNNYIFFAIEGKNTNGNQFIEIAIDYGYKYIVSEDLCIIESLAGKYPNILFFVVKNVQATLDLLARWGVSQFKGIKIAITGSAGKTTTTYLLQNLLKIKYDVVHTHKYNSQYYLRRLCFELYKHKEDFFIAELSSDTLGMIHWFSNIIQPDYSIITSIGNAHLEDFKSYHNIIEEKTSIINNTKIATFIPEEYRDIIASTKHVVSNLQKIHYVPNNFVVTNNHNQQIVSFFYKNQQLLKIENPKYQGNHNYSNMNLILHLFSFMDFIKDVFSVEKIRQVLENINCFPGRGNIIKIRTKDYNFKLVCEHHNSNPMSFAKAITNINEPTLVVMGFMYSLGEETIIKHHEILHLLNSNEYVKGIVLSDTKLLNIQNLDQYKKILDKKDSITDYLPFIKQNNITSVFLKGSRSSYLEKNIKTILNYIF